MVDPAVNASGYIKSPAPVSSNPKLLTEILSCSLIAVRGLAETHIGSYDRRL